MKRISFQVSALALIPAASVESFVPSATRYSRPALLLKPGINFAKRPLSTLPLSSSSPLPSAACNMPVASATTMSVQPSNRSGVLRRLVRCGGLSCLTNRKRRNAADASGGDGHRTASLLKSAAEPDEYDKDAEEDDDEYEDGEMVEYDDGLDRNIIKRLKRSATVFRQVSWLSWWAQTILSTVAFIILLFSNAVTNRSARGNVFGNGVALALGSLACSAASICWTWGYTLKARGWRRLGTLGELDEAQVRMRNSLKMGIYVNVVGMLLALIGAEQIVGTLVAKVLYSQGFQPSLMVGNVGAAEVAQAQFRALDVFIVQANTNTLLSHFCSLAASLWLLARTPKLANLAKGVY